MEKMAYNMSCVLSYFTTITTDKVFTISVLARGSRKEQCFLIAVQWNPSIVDTLGT